jgi:ABC-2 type transport system ATP-binding protein
VSLPGEITAEGLGRHFRLTTGGPRSLKESVLRRNQRTTRDLWAVRDVDLDIRPGEAFGIVGHNGSGKSTLLKLLAGIFAPSEGRLAISGRVGSLLEVGAGFHHEFTGAENVYLNAAIYGINRRYIDEHLDEIIAFAELEEFAHMPVKTYSTGMYTRLGFAVSMHIDPDVLLLDEVLAVGDEAFQRKCIARIFDYKASGGTLVFVSHDAAAVERLCDRALLLDHGQPVALGAAADVLREYHRRMASHGSAAVTVAGIAADRAGSARLDAVTVTGADGECRERFIEGEPFLLEVEISAVDDLRGATALLGLRDASGLVLARQQLTGVDIGAGDSERFQLELPSLPLHSGDFSFSLDVTAPNGQQLLSVARFAPFSVYSVDGVADGVLRLGGQLQRKTASTT